MSDSSTGAYGSDESEDQEERDDLEEYWLLECPFCDGDGLTTSARDVNGRISFDCPECGGTGWY